MGENRKQKTDWSLHLDMNRKVNLSRRGKTVGLHGAISNSSNITIANHSEDLALLSNHSEVLFQEFEKVETANAVCSMGK